jgi:cytidylate kinase
MGDKLAQKVTEGPNDPDIFKAIFLAGGPGSGKSFVSGKLLTGTGLKTINSDDIYEYLAKKNNLDLSDPDVVYSKQGQDVRDRAKKLTGMRKGGYLEGRLGVIIDGTGKDVAKVKQDSDALKELGYDTMMLFVNTSLNIAQQRNKMRPRQIPSKNVTSMWEKVQQNIMQFQQVFGAKDFHVVDNSGGLEDPDRAKNFDVVRKEIKSFLDNKNYNRIAKQWLQDQK